MNEDNSRHLRGHKIKKGYRAIRRQRYRVIRYNRMIRLDMKAKPVRSKALTA